MINWLYIDGSDYDWRMRPVISLSLTGINIKSIETVKQDLLIELILTTKLLNIEIINLNPVDEFDTLFKKILED
jgi:hypothetical protein